MTYRASIITILLLMLCDREGKDNESGREVDPIHWLAHHMGEKLNALHDEDIDMLNKGLLMCIKCVSLLTTSRSQLTLGVRPGAPPDPSPAYQRARDKQPFTCMIDLKSPNNLNYQITYIFKIIWAYSRERSGCHALEAFQLSLYVLGMRWDVSGHCVLRVVHRSSTWSEQISYTGLVRTLNQ